MISILRNKRYVNNAKNWAEDIQLKCSELVKNQLDLKEKDFSIEIYNLLSLERQNEKILLSNATNSVEVPKKFEHLVEFSFEQKLISIKKIKEKFQEIPDKEINEFVDSMKQMKVFI